MAPPPEYDKEPKAPDKSIINISNDDSKVRYNNIKDEPPSSDIKPTNLKVNTEVENNKDVETLDDGQLRALLDEAITYKCPKDREGKSSLFKELLEEVEQDEQCEAAARVSGSGRGGRRGRGRHEHHSSLQDLVAAMAAEPAPRRSRHGHAHHHAPPAANVSARTHHGGSLPSGVDTSFLLSEEPARGGYLATVRCVNPPPLTERRVSASDANPPAELDLLTRRSKPIFPMTYTARATLEIGSGSVSSGRAVTTTTASNQVRTSPTNKLPPQNPRPYRNAQYRLSILNNDRYYRELTCGPPEKLYRNRKPLYNVKDKPNYMSFTKVTDSVHGSGALKDSIEDDFRGTCTRYDETPECNKSYVSNINYSEGEDMDEKWNRIVNNWYGSFDHYTSRNQKPVGEFSTDQERIDIDSKAIEQRNRNIRFVTNLSSDPPNINFNNKNIENIHTECTSQGNRQLHRNMYRKIVGDLIPPNSSLINRRNIRNLTIAKIESSNQHAKTNISSSISNINKSLEVKSTIPSSNKKTKDCKISSRTLQNKYKSHDVAPVRDIESKSEIVENSPTVCSSSIRSKWTSIKVEKINNKFINDCIISSTLSNCENELKWKTNTTEDAKIISTKWSHEASDCQQLTSPASLCIDISKINVNNEIDEVSKTLQEDVTPVKLTAIKILKDNCLTIDENSNNTEINVSEVSSTLVEVDSAIPFSCITTPEIVSSCNTTTSTTQSDAVDLKPLQLDMCYRTVSSLMGQSPPRAACPPPALPRERAPPPDTPPPHNPTAPPPPQQPRSVISSSFNGLPLSRPNYGSTASTTDEYKKSLDENGNAVQGFSSPLSGSSQHKKPRRKKSSKNETVIKSHQIDGYQGNKDLNEVLRFIESNADGARVNKLGRAKHKDDSDDKCGKKRSTERRKDKENKIKRATSMEELSRTKLEDLTDNNPPLRTGKARGPDATPAKPERRSWGDDACAALLLRADTLGADAELVTDPAAELTDFQTVTKKRKPRRRTDETEREPAAEQVPRRARPPSPRARRISAPHSDRSNDSNDDMDSVHSLPADATRARPPPPPAPPSHASYADIARTRHNIPDLIESCNFYGEGEVESGTATAPVARADAEYPALVAGRRERDKVAGGVDKERDAPEPDVVADRRPPVILLDAGARARDLDGVTFGFDVNEQLLGGARADVVRDAEAGAVPHAVRAGCAALRYVPPRAPPALQLHLLVDYVAAAWEDIVKCGSSKVKYYSD